jgi:hypothetical protein
LKEKFYLINLLNAYCLAADGLLLGEPASMDQIQPLFWGLLLTLFYAAGLNPELFLVKLFWLGQNHSGLVICKINGRLLYGEKRIPKGLNVSTHG